MHSRITVLALVIGALWWVALPLVTDAATLWSAEGGPSRELVLGDARPAAEVTTAVDAGRAPRRPAKPTPIPAPSPTVMPTTTMAAPTNLSLFYHPPKDGTTLQTLVQRFESVIFTRGDEAYRDQMRAAGYSGPALQYLLANEASGPPRRDAPTGLRNGGDPCDRGLEISYFLNNATGIAGDFCAALHPDERNFLHNGRGERLYSTLSWQEMTGTKTVSIYMMNPAAPGWRAYFARRARENGPAVRYSGLFLDNVDLSLYRGQRQEINSDGVVAEYASNSVYRDAVVGYLAGLRAEIGAVNVWANTTGAYDSPWDEDPYLPYLNGVMNEFFVARWGGSHADPTAWESQVRQAEKVLGQGKAFLGVGQGPRTDTTRMRFALASYLLVIRDGAYFRYADGGAYEQAWLYDDYRTQLGAPTGGRYRAGGLWRRDFACGYVSVDVANHAGSIVTDARRPGCS